MEKPNLEDKSQTRTRSLEELIKREWETIEELQKMLKDTEISVTEKTRVASVFAFHVNTLKDCWTEGAKITCLRSKILVIL